jgi:UDP-glucose 4-epimerase
VADVVVALATLMDHEGTAGHVFNVGVMEETSILQLAQVVLEIVGSVSKIELVSHEEAYGPAFEDVRRRLPDITRIRSATGWEPTRTLRECVADVVAFERTSERLTPTSTRRSDTSESQARGEVGGAPSASNARNDHSGL